MFSEHSYPEERNFISVFPQKKIPFLLTNFSTYLLISPAPSESGFHCILHNFLSLFIMFISTSWTLHIKTLEGSEPFLYKI